MLSKIEDALKILYALGLPREQQNERSALALLALANLRPRMKWSGSEQPLLRVWDIMSFMRDVYAKDYAPNSRETIRRYTLHQFEQARLVNRNPDDPSRATNSGKNCYALTDEAFAVLRAFRTPSFDDEVNRFLSKFGSLQEAYSKRRFAASVPLVLSSDVTVLLSPGKHNQLQVAIVHEFGPRFAPGSRLLYLGDTAKKHAVCEAPALDALRIPITAHDKLPDIVLYDEKRNWLFLIEAVTSHGPVSPKRHHEIEKMLVNCAADRVYVTAFQAVADFRMYAADIAWETEVWIAEHPEHMIHFNGPKFLGPFKPTAQP